MKIAVPYENGQVFQNFGHSAQFKIQDTENGKILSGEIVSTNAANATFRNQIGVWRSSLRAFHLLTHGFQPHFFKYSAGSPFKIKSTSGNSCCSICNERVISADSQCSGLIQNPPCKSCTDLAVLRPIGAFPPAQQFIF